MAQVIQKHVAQQIVEAIKDVCTHDINFIDTNGIIFASTNPKRIGDYHEIGHQVAKGGESIEVETDNSFTGTQKGVNIPFIYKGETIGVIGISGVPQEVRKYAYLSQKITTLILREHELDIHEHTQKTQLNHMIRSMIHNEYVSQDYLADFAKKYHMNQKADYRTVIVKLDARFAPANLSLIEDRIYRAFDQTGSGLYTFNYPDEYILLMETEKFGKWQYVFEQLAEKNSPIIRIGIGNPAALARQHQSYRAAEIALHSLFGDEYVAVFEDLDLEILLGSLAGDVKEYFLKQTAASLSTDEQSLLKLYFSTNMSLKETCKQLFLHKNTLQYKLDKIHRKTGFNPRKFKDAVVLYIALKILAVS